MKETTFKTQPRALFMSYKGFLLYTPHGSTKDGCLAPEPIFEGIKRDAKMAVAVQRTPYNMLFNRGKRDIMEPSGNNRIVHDSHGEYTPLINERLSEGEYNRA